MKQFAVAMLNFFDNEMKVLKVEALNEVEACKIALIQNANQACSLLDLWKSVLRL